MGQEQSVPAPRRAPNKLSKPRTNTTGNLISKIPGTPSRQNSQSNNASPTKSKQSLLFPADVGEAVEKKEEKPRKRMSLFRSKSSQAKERQLELQLDTGVAREFVDPSPVERPVRRHSRANSVTFEEQKEESFSSRPPNHSRMSLQHFPYQQHHSRLSLVVEARSPEPAKVEPSKRLSYYEEEDPQTSGVLPRTNSESTIYGPIRRRSLLQHGVATRKSLFAANDSRQSLPSQLNANEFQDYYYDQSKPTSSPLSDLANLRREFDNGTPGPRVETPTDQGYGHIGVYKLGSLRITNGAASPAPSEGRPSTSEDYMTAGTRTSHESPRRHGLGQRSNTLAAPLEIMRTQWTARSESPLRQAHEAEPEQLTIDTQLPLPDPSFALFDFSSRDSPTKSLELAKEYMQDLALSPFSFETSPVPSPRLESTSKHMAVEDDLFEPEPNSPNLSALEHASRSFDSGYGTGETKVIPGPREVAPKPLAKADSGYSSNVSLRSFKKDGPAVPEKEAPPAPPKEISRVASSTYSVSSRVPSSAYSVSSQASDVTLRAQRSLPSLPAEEYIPPPPARDAPPVPPKHQEIQHVQRPSANVLQKQHTRQQSLPPTLPKAIRPTPIPASKPTSSTKRPQKPQRPHSFQPTSLPVYTVSAHLPSTSSLPPVPAETSRKLDERVDNFPVVSFPNTLAGMGLRRSCSKETLGTIFSVGSAEVRAEMNFAKSLPAIPVHGRIPESSPITISPEPKSKPEFPSKPEYNRRNTYQPMPSSQVPTRKPFEARRSMQSLPRETSIPRKSIEQQQEDFEAHVTSFDTISSSLGSGPYAIATTTRPSSSASAVLTSQFESEAALRFQAQKSLNSRKSFDSQRNVSGSNGVLRDRKSFDSHSSQRNISGPFLGNRKSYDSIAAGNPFTAPQLPTPSAGKPQTPTSSHSRKGSREYPPQAHSNASIKRPFTFVPPVPAPQFQPREQGGIGIKKTKSPPPVSMQTRKSLPAPSRPPPPQPQPQDKWAQPATFWAERRKSAGEALRRTSQEMSRPGSARPSVEMQRPRQAQNLRAYPSFDQRDVWEANHASYQSYSYDYSPPPSQTQVQYQEAEYYDQEDAEADYKRAREMEIRGNSTQDMLILSRETGGHGQGLGTGRGGGRWGSEWGVDLCDVPVFLRRVGVES